MPTTITIRERHQQTGVLARLAAAVRSYTVDGISLKDPALAKFFNSGYENTAGVVVNEETAFAFSAVYDAVNQISSDIGKLPLKLKKRVEGAGSEDHVGSKVYRLLKDQANPDMTAMVFRRTLQAHALTTKGGFAEIERDGSGRPAALWPMTPDRVEPLVQKIELPNGRYRTRLRYRIDGKNDNILESADVIHIHGLGYDGYCAYPVIQKARQAIGLALAAERFGGAFFGNNANFGGVLASDQDLDPDQAKELQERIEKAHKGPDKAWKMLVLGAGFKYFRTGVTPTDSQMDATRSQQIEEIARFFNIPVHKLKNLDRATNNNIEQQDLEYYKGCLLTWITLWEQELNRKLIAPLEAGQQFIKHNAKAFLRADTAGRTAMYTALLDRGVYNADDVLELEDENPQPAGQGKIYLVQGAMVPKDKLVELVDAKIKAATQPTPAPNNPNTTDPTADPNAVGRALDDALARASRAEAAAAESTQTALEERERRIALEATGTATAAELVASRDAEQRASALSTQLTTLSGELRAEAEAQRQRATAAEERSTQDHEATLRAEAALTAAQAEVGVATTAVAEAEVRAADAQAVAIESRSLASEAERLAVEARAEADRVSADREEGRASLQALEAASAAAQLETVARERDHVARAAEAAEARAAAETARLELERRTEDAEAATRAAQDRTTTAERAFADENATRAQAMARVAELEPQVDELIGSRDAAAQAADESRRQMADLEIALTEARAQASLFQTLTTDQQAAHMASVQALEAAVTALERSRDEALAMVDRHEAAARAAAEQVTAQQVEIRTLLEADTSGIATLVQAHHALVVDVMRRMVERETDRARRAQGTPEKVQRWLESFYEGHADLMRAALLPAVRVHLAFIRAVEDPIEATRRLVDVHVAQSQRQIAEVIEGDADALAVSLSALLYRWDVQRPDVIANQLMEKELTYARRF